MKKYISLSTFIILASCSTLNFTGKLKKNLSVIERNNYFLYFYPGSEIYIKEDKFTGDFSIFFNVLFEYKKLYNAKEIKVLKDNKLIGSIKISKIVSISNLRFLYIDLNKDNTSLMLDALNAHKKITFQVDSNSFQVWTKEAKIYDSRYIDINFESTRNTLKYAIRSNIL